MYFNLSGEVDKFTRMLENSIENNSLLYLRKLLSGMVFFRVEIFPFLYPIIIESNTIDAIDNFRICFDYHLRIECEFKYWALMNPIDTNNLRLFHFVSILLMTVDSDYLL
ncbi:hypothetical protein PRIPAC_73450 [Pristionchus pacificus]|uniref:Uncharacterized protein n=1 Tax=Pristionchus pacificus TaxID=54126 RepID=A0A8R1V510_PRIPA|nr:hypothetical protein PRIPAC_73450 [Pristionchus pacificus]